MLIVGNVSRDSSIISTNGWTLELTPIKQAGATPLPTSLTPASKTAPDSRVAAHLKEVEKLQTELNGTKRNAQSGKP